MQAHDTETVASEPQEAEDLARLSEFLSTAEERGVRVIVDDEPESLPVPASVVRLMTSAVHALARGDAVSVTAVDADLTTQEAADLLNVSRPFLIKLLESGEIPYYKVGSHRRIPRKELVEYRERRSQVRRRILAEMARDAQEAGIYE